MRNAAYYGRIAAVAKRMDGYGPGRLVNSSQRAIQTKPDDYDIRIYSCPEKFLDGLVGIFCLKRKTLPRAEDVATMPEGFSVLTLPSGHQHVVGRLSGNYGIMQVRQAYGDSHFKEFVERLRRGPNHVRS